MYSIMYQLVLQWFCPDEIKLAAFLLAQRDDRLHELDFVVARLVGVSKQIAERRSPKQVQMRLG